jgi:hypothetical protein
MTIKLLPVLAILAPGAIFKIMLTGTQDFADGFQYSYNGQPVAPVS